MEYLEPHLGLICIVDLTWEVESSTAGIRREQALISFYEHIL